MNSTQTTVIANPKQKKLPIFFDSLGLTALSDEQQTLISQIDACLPQTQCGLCEHADGCLPYAHAIVTQGEPHNKCVPGGQPVSDKIAQLAKRPAKIAQPSKWSIDTDSQRPQEVRAIIREDECIGCTKCIPACPVDAIIGTAKHMHTIITELCTGCELCLTPCPVDCIDLQPIQRTVDDSTRQQEQANLRHRYYGHLNRVTKQIQDKQNNKPVISVIQSKITSRTNSDVNINESQAKNTIASAKIRAKIKKLTKQLAVKEDVNKQNELLELTKQLADINPQQ